MTSRRWVIGVGLVGILAAGAFANRAALRGPLALDDFAQRAMIEGTLTPRRGPLNLYDFVADDNRAALVDRGAIPWWSDPGLSIRFLRPLSSVLVWLDHWLFGYTAVGPHVLSFLWWAGAVLAAYVLYATLLGRRSALVAALAFSLSATLAIPLVWLANRDTLLTLTFGALALVFYVRWRQDRQRPMGLAAAAAVGASALCGEYALCLAGYLVAFEICHRNESWRRRLTGLLPGLAPLLAYVVAHVVLAYGAVGSGFYRDPVAAPGAYFGALRRSFSILLGAAWLNVDETSSWLQSPWFTALALLSAATLVLGLSRLARRRRLGAPASGAAWLACGSVLALLPPAATEPSRRIIGVAALGLSGAVGFLVVRCAREVFAPSRAARVLAVAVIAALGYIHLVSAALETRKLSLTAVEAEISNLAQFDRVRRRDPARSTVLVLRANYPSTVLWAPFLLREEAPAHWWVLSQTFAMTAAIRTAPNAIEVAVNGGPLFTVGPSDIFRTTPFNAGDVVQLAGFRATILRVDRSGQPASVRYELAGDVAGENVAWISEGSSGFGGVGPPPVGFGVRVAP